MKISAHLLPVVRPLGATKYAVEINLITRRGVDASSPVPSNVSVRLPCVLTLAPNVKLVLPAESLTAEVRNMFEDWQSLIITISSALSWSGLFTSVIEVSVLPVMFTARFVVRPLPCCR